MAVITVTYLSLQSFNLNFGIDAFNCSLVDKHREELSNKPGKGKIQHHWIKDYLAEYAESFPQVSTVLEANVHQCIYGQKGFEYHTFQEMWELYSQYSAQKDRPEDFSMIQKAYNSVSQWLHTPVTHIASVQMKRFRKYIYDKTDQVSFVIHKPSYHNFKWMFTSYYHFSILLLLW